MSKVVCFKLINGQEMVGKLNDDAAVLAEYAHLGGVVVLDEALIFNLNVIRGEDGEQRAQISFLPAGITVKGQGPSRVALSTLGLTQIDLDSNYEEGYERALSPIVRPGGGGRIIT